ncbi:MAG: ABC transporter permease, partial [Gammaproteobacteria bacterium]|nr:ABC transporter permease [Gammaproteobacteria bacterium]
MNALTRKLLRDLWLMRGQVLAIIIVIASGVATFIMSVSTLNALQQTRTQVYIDYRFADVFASLKRAPQRLLKRVAAIPDVDTVASRVVAQVRMEIPVFNDPVVGQLVSIPDHGPITINALFLRQGKLPQPDRHQVLISEPFANAHKLQPGDQMTAIINGRRQTLDISGIALSPEYIYSLGPGAMFPDDKRFG